MMPVNILVEGASDEPVAKMLLKHAGLAVGVTYGRNGKAHVLERVQIYNKAAHRTPWFILVDLDQDTNCPSDALSHWLPDPAVGMRFRIAVRAVEAWLLADRESMANFLAVGLSKIPDQLDTESNPKQALIRLAQASRNRRIREEMVPRPGSGAKVGPRYIARLTDFTENHWRPGEGKKHSQSLRRCIEALSTLKNFSIPQS